MTKSVIYCQDPHPQFSLGPMLPKPAWKKRQVSDFTINSRYSPGYTDSTGYTEKLKEGVLYLVSITFLESKYSLRDL